jgi:AraC-like DNA-binding protein
LVIKEIAKNNREKSLNWIKSAARNMNTSIPHIEFNSSFKEDFGFEIVPISKIAKGKDGFSHNPELPHQLKFYNLIYFTKGTGRHYIDFNWYDVQKNSLIYLTKEQVTAFDFSEGLEGYCLIFTEEYFVHCFSSLSNDFVYRLFNPELFSPIVQIPLGSDFKDYFSLLNKEFMSNTEFNKKSIVESLFTILVSKAEQIKQNQTLQIKDSAKINIYQRFNSLIEKNLSKSRSAEYYAGELAITYKHLNTICKELLNKTAKNAIDDLVILRAKRDLINGDLKTSAIAFDLGFEDPTNFTKFFKKKTSLTPKQFVESIKNA